MRRQWESDTGAALIAVVWVTLLMAILALGVLNQSITSRKIPISVHERKQAEYLAESAIAVYLQRHLLNETNDFVLFKSIEILGKDMSVSVELEDAKVGLNKADRHLLSATFASNGYDTALADAVADAIVDWRDQDDIVTGAGAEADNYSLLGAPRNGPFETVGELVFVQGVAPEMVRCLSPLMTVYSSPDIEDVSLPYASDAVKSVFEWAFANNWHGQSWRNPDDLDADTDKLDLASRAITITVWETGLNSPRFSKVLRIKTSTPEETTFVNLTPLRADASERTCSS